jgi:hypothetical protein
MRQIRRTKAAPVKERRLIQQRVQPPQEMRDGRNHTGILSPGVGRGIRVLRSRLEKDEYRPGVIGAVFIAALQITHRPQPAIILLVGQDMVHPAVHFGPKPGIPKEHGQGHDAIKPVRTALPALGMAADPAALGHVGPEFVQVAAQAISLSAQLTLKPAQWAYGAQRQGRQGEGVQAVGVAGQGHDARSSLGFYTLPSAPGFPPTRGPGAL